MSYGVGGVGSPTLGRRTVVAAAAFFEYAKSVMELDDI